MADLSKTVAIIFQGTDQTGAALNSVAGNLDKIGTEAGQAAPQVAKVGEEAEKLGDKGQGIDTLVASMKALAGAVVVKEFIDANIEAEKFGLAMTQIKGSTQAAAQEFEYIKSVANTLGLEINSAAQAYTSLSASTKGTALEGQATRDIYESVAKAMSTLGRSSADTEGALLAISQIVSKGTVSLEELRGQLGERLPGAFQLAAKAMGLTTQELDALVSSGNLAATDFLPKLAAELRKTYGQTEYVDTFVAGSNRLKNALQNLYQVAGEQTGAFDFLATGANVASKSIELGTDQIGNYKAVFTDLIYLFRTGDFSTVWERIEDRTRQANIAAGGHADQTRKLRDAFNDLEKQSYTTGEEVKAAMDKGVLSGKELEKATKEVDAALKTLGIDPKQFKDPIEEIVKAFNDLANNPAVTGDQFLSGFLVTLQKVKSQEDINGLTQQLTDAFERGAIGADKLGAGLEALKQKQSGVFDALPDYSEKVNDNAETLKKQAAETDKAKESAQKFALEMEKIASDERIKFIEAKVSLDIAQLEADVKKFEAVFSSIDNTVNSTGELLGSLFGQLGDYDSLSFSAIRQIEAQIEKENKAREQAFELQKNLTEAQIENMRAQTRALNSGDALIKIDGDGLKPHLEAFMWEILKAIQVRVNADGLKMLLGT